MAKKMYEVTYNGYLCYLKFGAYSNKRIQISLIDFFDDLPMAHITLNLLNVNYPSDHILIKSYSENEGIYEALLEAKIIGPYVKKIPICFSEALQCPLLISP